MRRFYRVAILLGTFTFGASVWAQDSGARRPLAEEAKGLMSEEDFLRASDENFLNILGRPGNGPQVGAMAPDFNLMPLKFYEFGIDARKITIDNSDDLYKPVRLSDFRGHKPVVLMFGSYT